MSFDEQHAPCLSTPQRTTQQKSQSVLLLITLTNEPVQQACYFFYVSCLRDQEIGLFVLLLFSFSLSAFWWCEITFKCTEQNGCFKVSEFGWQNAGTVRPQWNVSPCLTWSSMIHTPPWTACSVVKMCLFKPRVLTYPPPLHTFKFPFIAPGWLLSCPLFGFQIIVAMVSKHYRHSNLEWTSKSECTTRLD